VAYLIKISMRDQELTDYLNDQDKADAIEDALRAKEVQRQKEILEPFHTWLGREMPHAIGSKVFHDYENACFEFGPYYVSVEGDVCVGDSQDGIVEYLFEKFLESQPRN